MAGRMTAEMAVRRSGDARMCCSRRVAIARA